MAKGDWSKDEQKAAKGLEWAMKVTGGRGVDPELMDDAAEALEWMKNNGPDEETTK